jgi:predicted metal-dependent hydrolase
MAFKQFVLDDGTAITIYKRKSSRSLRLSITSNGIIRVSIPMWVSYSQGLSFAQSRKEWIHSQRTVEKLINPGAAIGKAHHILFQSDPGITKPTTRVRNNEVVIIYPTGLGLDDPLVQTAARTAGIRALRTQASLLLPQRLSTLAIKYGFNYKSVTIKQLKGRWGSCDQEQNIVLNLFLMQLPWDCIDYVLLHELTHTKVLHHGPDFWRVMNSLIPNVRNYRKVMKNYRPILEST